MKHLLLHMIEYLIILLLTEGNVDHMDILGTIYELDNITTL